ncbi:MAG: hypothetical protein ABJL44_07355 [Algibacter sp.]
MKRIIIILSLTISYLGYGQIIDTGDKVGIGTTTPSAKLEVKSTNNLRTVLNRNDQSAISFLPNNGNSIFHISHGLNNDLNISQGTDVGQTNIMTILNSGRIGIGTNTPTDKLEIVGNLRINGSNTNDQIRFESQNGFHRIAFHQLRFYDWEAGGDNLTINDGNIGIGTTTPAEKLQVTGNISSYEGDIYFNNSTTNQEDSGAIRWNEYGENSTNESGAFIKYNGSNNYLQFMTNTETTDFEHLRIYRGGNLTLQPNSGNVGIGTITPDSKLTVAGKIHAREVKVTIDAGADFVFNDNYKLPPLQEVSQFIKEHKHLPEIASEKEMQENGLHLAEMNIKLLQKIEELTLYTIEQQKEIKSQSSKIDKLEKENKELQSFSKRISDIEKSLNNKRE